MLILVGFATYITVGVMGPKPYPIFSASEVHELTLQAKRGDASAEKQLFHYFVMLEESPSKYQELSMVSREIASPSLQFFLFHSLTLAHECRTEKLLAGYQFSLPKLGDREYADTNLKDLRSKPVCEGEIAAKIDSFVDMQNIVNP